MILWHPSKNNQRYAFTPLLDDSENDNDDDVDDDDELYNHNRKHVYEMLKLRPNSPIKDTIEMDQKFTSDNKIMEV